MGRGVVKGIGRGKRGCDDALYEVRERRGYTELVVAAY